MTEPFYRTTNLCGPYEVIRFLKSGGMGDVYVAKHRDNGAIVALKCLRSCHRGDRTMAVRMKREAEFLGLMRHRNIVRVFDAGMADDGTLWMALELLAGSTLREIMRAMGRLSLLDALYIALHVAEGMEAVHEYGGIHRDLKPENVMVTTRREVKVLDFGIAKLYRLGDQQSTDRSHVVGTPHYMSPEHLKGESVDVRTDIYALGLIIYEMLTGRHVFAGDGEPLTSDQVSRMQIHTDPLLPPRGTAHIPTNVWPIIERALKKQRDERYVSMAEMAEDIYAAGLQARREGAISVLFNEVVTRDEADEESDEGAEPTWDMEPFSSNKSGGACSLEGAPEPVEGPRYWKTWPRGAKGRENGGSGTYEAKTLELQRGDSLRLVSPILPFQPSGESAANDAVERAGSEERNLSEEREPEGEVRAMSRPTVRLRVPAVQTMPRDIEEDIPTKRARAYLSAVPAMREATPTIGKLPRHVMLALVLGPLASGALSVGLMQALFHTSAPEARPAAEKGRAPVPAEPMGSPAQAPLATPCPAAMDSVMPKAASISSVVAVMPSAPVLSAPAVAPAAKEAPSPPRAKVPPAPAARQPSKAPSRIF